MQVSPKIYIFAKHPVSTVTVTTGATVNLRRLTILTTVTPGKKSKLKSLFMQCFSNSLRPKPRKASRANAASKGATIK